MLNVNNSDKYSSNVAQNGENITMSKKRFAGIVSIVSVCVAVVMFTLGYFAYYLSVSSSARSLDWLKKTIDKQYLYEVTDEQFLQAATAGINNYLLDDYSAYYSPSEYNEVAASRAGNMTGIGISMTMDNSLLKIVHVYGNSPAYAAGFKHGMYVVGVSTTNAAVTDMDYNEASVALGEAASNVDLFVTVKTSLSGSASVLTVQKEQYKAAYVFYSTNDTDYYFEYSEQNGNWSLKSKSGGISGLGTDCGYLQLISYRGDATAQFEAALSQHKLSGKGKLIIDLRNNGGGSNEVVDGISAYLLKNAEERHPVVNQIKYSDGNIANEYASGNYYDDYFNASSKIYVMANAGTASASELMMGAMLSYGTIGYGDIYLSELNGTAKTYGKGIMQTYYMRGTGEVAKLTSAQLYWPNGNTIHGVGITKADGANAVPVTTLYPDCDDRELQDVINIVK